MNVTMKKWALGSLTLGLFLIPSIAFAQEGDGVIGLIRFFISVLQESTTAIGYLMGFIGILAMGFGVFNIIQHFRTESRDDPNQKSRVVYGIVSFICGIFLANGAYQRIGSGEDFQASVYEDRPAVVAYVEFVEMPELG